MNFTWIPFYKEFSQKLLKYRSNRTPLVNWIYDNLAGYVKYLKDNPDGRPLPDMDPFTVFGIINRGIAYDKKVYLCSKFKNFLKIDASEPQDFSGVPEMNNLLSSFIGYGKDREEGDIERLWDVFECAVLDKDIENAYDSLRGQYLIKYNLTMGLFWIRPDKFLALDGNNREKLISLGIASSFDYKFVPYKEYVSIMKRLDEKMKSESLGFSNYAEFSHGAYIQNDGASKRDTPSDVGTNRTAKESSESTEKQQYWWLVANPMIWSLSEMQIGEEQDYSLYNENGHKRRIFSNFLNAKKGDVIIGYESSPTQKILCLLEVSKASDGKSIYFKKTKNIASPIDFNTLKEIKELENMEYMRSQQGSLFKVTPDEYHIIMKLSLGEDPIFEKAKNDSYTKNNFLDEVYLEPEDYDKLERLLLRKKNLIIQGAPGVGKTFAAKRLAYTIMGEKDDRRVMQIQFHQNYSYEDFVMGYKPNDKGGFDLQEGIFYNFCKKAEGDRDHQYFFIIDEINRGNLSKIFGELLMLIEKDYRDKPIQLAYTKESFSVPSNIYIIGMMNTADRSLAMIDYALRRRFSFFEMKPGFDSPLFKEYIENLRDPYLGKLVKAIMELNKVIEGDDSLGSGFCIGHSYLCNLESNYDLDNIVEYDIIPMIREYWFDNDSVFYREAQKLRDVLK